MEMKGIKKRRSQPIARFFHGRQYWRPKGAYETIINERPRRPALGRNADAYRAPRPLPLAPYVCLEIADRRRPRLCSPPVRSP